MANPPPATPKIEMTAVEVASVKKVAPTAPNPIAPNPAAIPGAAIPPVTTNKVPATTPAVPILSPRIHLSLLEEVWEEVCCCADSLLLVFAEFANPKIRSATTCSKDCHLRRRRWSSVADCRQRSAMSFPSHRFDEVESRSSKLTEDSYLRR